MKYLVTLFVFALGTLQALAAESVLIVQLVNPWQVKRIAAEYNVELLDTAPYGPFVLYGVETSRHEEVQTQMNLDPRIVWAEDDVALDSPEGLDQRPEDIHARVGGTIPAIFDTAAGLFYNSGYVKQIRWQSTPFLPGLDRQVRVAILDTGLSPRQPLLWTNVIASYDATGNNSVWDWPTGTDTNQNGLADEGLGHGTFVTSIVATLAPHVKLVVVKAADSDGVSDTWSLIKGLSFAVHNQCELANISLGAIEQPAALGDVIEWAEGLGLTVVAGAGNDETDRALYPARFSNVVGVSGVDGKDRKADFSNWDGHLRQAAPAVSIAGAWWKGGMVGWSGTSFATPIVTACLADTARKRGTWTPEQVLDLCESTGVNINAINQQFTNELGLRVDWQMLLDAQTNQRRRKR